MKYPTTILKCKSSLLLLVLLLLLGQSLVAQSVSTLKRQREALLKDINVTSKILQETNTQKSATLDQYITLKTQTKKRKLLIQNLDKELNNTEESIVRTEEIIITMTEDIEQLKNDFSKMARKSYLQRRTKNNLLFLLSAQDFNQLYKRWVYGVQRQKRIRHKASIIEITKNSLKKKITNLSKSKLKKSELLLEQRNQTLIFEKELAKQNKLLDQLKAKENQLRSELAIKLKKDEYLRSAISDVINSDIAKTNNTLESPNTTVPNNTVHFGELTRAFFGSKGNLLMPVHSGVISKKYGDQPHPTIRNLSISNNGIDIRTYENADIRAVFKGVVSSVAFIPSFNYTIIVRHGDYYTVYSNLSEAYVNSGDTIDTAQAIGKVFTDPVTFKSEVHFEIWEQENNQDPSIWVKK